MSSVNMKELLEAGVHFGHQTRRWNPKMKRYIFGRRGGIYIIDLQKTLVQFEEAAEYVREMGRDGRRLLFVGTKRQAQEVISEEAIRCGQFYVTHRWLGGTLTNFVTIRQSVDRWREIERWLEEDDSPLTKKELLRMERERLKMTRNLSGIREMDQLPDALFVVDPKREHIAVAEANKLSIPVIAIVDTNCDPELIDHIIPGNDDAIRTIRLFANRIAEAYLDGAGELDKALAAEQAEEAGAAGGSESAPDAASGAETESGDAESATAAPEESTATEAASEPETSEPETSEPETSEAETSEAESAEAETSEAESAEAESADSESAGAAPASGEEPSETPREADSEAPARAEDPAAEESPEGEEGAAETNDAERVES